MRVDAATNCILVRGAVPGSDRGVIQILDSPIARRFNASLFEKLRDRKPSEKGEIEGDLLPFPTLPDALIARMAMERVATPESRDSLAIVDVTDPPPKPLQ